MSTLTFVSNLFFSIYHIHSLGHIFIYTSISQQHPGSTKIYQDLKTSFLWSRMKKDVSEFVTKFMVSQKVKTEHQVPLGFLQPIRIPEWKWDQITMDFVVGLPLTGRRHDSFWVVVD